MLKDTTAEKAIILSQLVSIIFSPLKFVVFLYEYYAVHIVDMLPVFSFLTTLCGETSFASNITVEVANPVDVG
jgi:hypothetical protein